VTGGGSAIYSNGDLIIKGSSFINNIAGWSGGAISLNNFVNATITNSNFNNNSVDKYGGAITNNANLTVDSYNFTGNGVRNPQYGGGAISVFNCYEVSLNLRNSIFKNNTASQGGALYIQKNTAFIDEKNIYLPPVSTGHNDIAINM
jgi:hypothetical protein